MQLKSEEVEALGQHGWFVRDGFLGRELSAAARDAATGLADQGALLPAGVRRGAAHRLDATVRNDRITWIDAEAEGALGQVFRRFDHLREQLNQEAWLGLRRTELQLAWYPPDGAHYDRHLDSFPGSDNRRVTALVYLNPNWVPTHGGLLRLHVDPLRDVEPLADRCVVFLSERIEHEVLPSFADRYAIAAWFSR